MSAPIFNILDTEGVPLSPTSPDAVPDLDGWGWDSYWSIDDWMTWHDAMKRAYGLDHANQNFLHYWFQQTAGATTWSDKWLNDQFVSYIRANGLDDVIDDASSALYRIRQVPGTIAAGTNAALGAIDTTARAAQALSWLLPVALVVIVFGKYLAEPSEKIKRLVT